MNTSAPKKRLYFAHPKGTYDSNIETTAQHYLKALFPRHEIVNPSDPEHQQHTDRKISYFKQLAGECDDLVYLPFGDETIASSTAEEIKSALRNKRNVHELHVRDSGMPSSMCSKVEKLDTTRVLSIEHTVAHNRVAKEMAQSAGSLRR